MKSLIRPWACFLSVTIFLSACGGGGGGGGGGNADNGPQNVGDNVAPVTASSLSGGEFNTPQEVTLSCTDTGGSGCAGIYYTLDGNIPTVNSQRYSAPIEVNNSLVLKYFAVDQAGNGETVQSQTFFIGPPPPFACAAPAAPNLTSGSYGHRRYELNYPDAVSDWVTDVYDELHFQPLAISHNGARTALAYSVMQEGATEVNTDTFRQTLFVYSPLRNTPLWFYDVPPEQIEVVHNGLSQDVLRSLLYVAMSRDGRSVAAFNGNRLLLFQCDQPTPLWSWDGERAGSYGDAAGWRNDLHFSANGDYILANMPHGLIFPTQTRNGVQHVLVFRRDLNHPLRTIAIQTINTIDAAISGDGSRVAVITRYENPDDLAGNNAFAGPDYIHSRVMMYEHGNLLWSTWFYNECEVCDDRADSSFALAEVEISTDGSIVVASGPGGKIRKYNASTGAVIAEVQETVPAVWTGPITTGEAADHLSNLVISDNADRVAVLASLSGYSLTSGVVHPKGIVFVDGLAATAATWRTDQRIRPAVDYSPDRNPTPHGFELVPEELFQGFAFQDYPTAPYRLPPFLSQLTLSTDGNLMTVRDFPDDTSGMLLGIEQQGGHIFAFYHGSHVPFQYLSEDEPGNDSDLSHHVLSGDGAWSASIAIDPDVADGHSEGRPRLTMHLHEMPPGMIIDVETDVTFLVDSDAGTILDILSDASEAVIQRHVVKPGRAAVLYEQLRNTTLAGELAADLCIPWESTRNRTHNWGQGFRADSSELSWGTPTCLLNAVGQSVMVLRAELFRSGGGLVDQDYDSYLHFQWYTQ